MQVRQVLALSAILATGASAQAATFDFETPGQYASNFRQLGGTATQTQTSNATGNNYVVSQATNTSNAAVVYDATPLDATAATASKFSGPVTISLDALFQSTTASPSLGVYLIDPNAESGSNSLLALFNLSGGSGDQVRFASNAQASTVGAGTLSGTTGTSGFQAGSWGHVTVQYGIDANNHPTLSMTAGSLTNSTTFSSVTAPSNVEVGFRLSPKTPVGSGDLYIDNVNIASTPEPSSLGLLSLGGLLLMRRRRRA